MVIKQSTTLSHRRTKQHLSLNTSNNNTTKAVLPYGDGHISPHFSNSCSSSITSPTSSIECSSKSSQFPLKNSRENELRKGSHTTIQTLKLNASNFITIIGLVCAGFYILSTSSEITRRRSQLSELQQKYQKLKLNMDESEEALLSAHANYIKLEGKVDYLKNRNERLKEELHEEINKNRVEKEVSFSPAENLGKIAREEVTEYLVRRKMAMEQRINKLQEKIKKMDRKEAEEKYGSGQLYVKINLEKENNNNNGIIDFSFIVEMAPLAMMPHSVHYFLQTVESEMWNNTVLLHTAEHVLPVAPLDKHGNNKITEFINSGLPELSFPEYNNNYQHEKYTIGFAGRPGGPDFYINIEDNSLDHGPGGQSHHDLHEEGDPCFGKVVKGFEVLDELHRISKMVKNMPEDSLSDVSITTTIHSAQILYEI